MNRIMGVQETRPFWKVRLTAMLMTLSQAAILIVAFVTTLAWPQIIRWLGLSQTAAVLATMAQGITVFVIILLSFSLTLYFGPDADQRWEWITPGSLIGTLILLCVSLLFRVYVQNWANYSATYGSLAGVVILISDGEELSIAATAGNVPRDLVGVRVPGRRSVAGRVLGK